MYRGQHRRTQALVSAAEIGLVALAFETAYQARVWLTSVDLAFLNFEREFFILVRNKALLLLFCVLMWFVLSRWLRVHEPPGSLETRSILFNTLRQAALAVVALVLFQYLLRLDLSRPFIVLFGLSVALLLSAFRVAAARSKWGFLADFAEGYFVLIVGTGPQALEAAREIGNSPASGLRLRGFCSLDSAAEDSTAGLPEGYPVYPISELPRILREQVVDEVIFAVQSRELAELEDIVLLCDEEGVRSRLLLDFFPHVQANVYLDHLNTLPVLTYSSTPHDEVKLLAKRALDITASLLALVILSPLLLLIAILIRATSPGPVFFRQERCGLNGRRFTLYKFRSMVANAEELQNSLAHLNTKKTAFKIPNDPRLTRAGKLLRKFSLDELPQLWNVLQGDMSLVGPRPPVPREVENYERWQRRRLRMRPGLTCLWTLAGRDTVDFDTWMKLDLWYIDHWSLGLDLRILVQTVPHVVLGKGAN